jgi:hypothetical protein
MKVLVAGIVESEEAWTILLEKVASLHSGKHGPFDVLLVLPGSIDNPLEFPLPVVHQATKFQTELDVQVVDELSATPIYTVSIYLHRVWLFYIIRVDAFFAGFFK